MGTTPSGSPLSRRLAWVTALRLVVLVALLGVLSAVHFRRPVDALTARAALLVLGVGFLLTGACAWALRRGGDLRGLAAVQLLLDPLIWTVMVYLSGGPLSGGTSLYGLGCVVGALLSGFRGAAIALSLSLLSFTTLLFGAGLGWWPPAFQSSAPPAVGDLVYSGFVNALAMLVVAALAGSLAERLHATGGQLAKANARAADAERLATMGRVAAALAHEIRNPLGAIAGSVRLLAENPELSSQDARLCGIIQRETGRLSDLVTDMLDLSKPRAPRPERVNVTALAEEVVTLARNWGRAAGDVGVHFRSEGHLWVSADASQLRQLVWNLVRNAVQASQSGGAVDVRVRQRAGFGELEVSDQGIGLSEEAQLHLFDAFHSSRSGGTGLGLAVVKRIAEDHGFAIDVQSVEGRGARFEVRLGRALAAPHSPATCGSARQRTTAA